MVRIIQFLYPSAVLLRDFAVSDDGNGPQISHWNTAALGAQPTLEFLESKRAEAEAALETRRQREAAELTNRTTLETQAANALANLRTYRALSNPTAAQTTAIVKVLCGVGIWLVRLQLRRLESTD